MGADAEHPQTLARTLGLDVDVTTRVLRAAAASRLVRFDQNGRARLSRIGAPLCKDHRRSISAAVAFQASPIFSRAYDELGGQLRDGAEPSGQRRAFGQSLWEYFGQHPDEAANFANGMRQLSAMDIQALVRGYPWPRRGVICDVAGGIGTLLAAILERRRGASGILIDAPEVLDEAGPFLNARGMAHRIERRQGDLFGEIDARADVYVLKWILHDWGDDACRKILSQVRAAMPPGAKVVTVDQHQEPSRPSSLTSMTDLNLLVACEGGRERSPEQVRALMRDAGLRDGQVRHAGLHMLVEGVA
jgi:hypothetical protein